MSLPESLRAHLDTPALAGLWAALRDRLERSGHAIRGSVAVDLDEDAADHLGGLLGRPIEPGARRIKLADLDAALRSSSAGRGLAAVVAELTGSALRDRPAERATRRADWEQVWAELDSDLAGSGLARAGWVAVWVQWLHRSGIVTRLGPDRARERLRPAVRVLCEILPALPADAVPTPRPLGELASQTTGSAHGLDDGGTVPALVLRAAALALDLPPPAASTQRREMWQRLGVEPDAVSGTVLVWALRPPGSGAWSQMMRARADLGVVTHLTVHELRRQDVPLSDDVVHGCENPQVLQALADSGVDRPLACLFGNPSAAGLLLAARTRMRYHGDFDWPGVAIARRVLAAGAEPWRMCRDDYLDAVSRVPPDSHLALSGPTERTPWDDELATEMSRRDVAVHEEAVVDVLRADLA